MARLKLLVYLKTKYPKVHPKQMEIPHFRTVDLLLLFKMLEEEIIFSTVYACMFLRLRGKKLRLGADPRPHPFATARSPVA